MEDVLLSRPDRQGLKAQNQAAYVKILCERKAGEVLSAIPRKKNQHGLGKDARAMMAQAGIPEQTGRRWQYLARFPEANLLRLVALCNEDEDELTSMFVIAAARAYLNRMARHETTAHVAPGPTIAEPAISAIPSATVRPTWRSFEQPPRQSVTIATSAGRAYAFSP